MGLDFWLYPKGEIAKSFVEVSGYSNKEICVMIEKESYIVEDMDTSYYTYKNLQNAIILLRKMNTSYSNEIAIDIEKGISEYKENQIFESYCSM